jgi:hypothetical protein
MRDLVRQVTAKPAACAVLGRLRQRYCPLTPELSTSAPFLDLLFRSPDLLQVIRRSQLFHFYHVLVFLSAISCRRTVRLPSTKSSMADEQGTDDASSGGNAEFAQVRRIPFLPLMRGDISIRYSISWSCPTC